MLAAAVRVRRVMEVCFMACLDVLKVYQNSIYFDNRVKIGE
jgi:hypothetical protein